MALKLNRPASTGLPTKIVLATALPMLLGFGAMATAPSASATTVRGGVDVALYCAEMVPTFTLTYDFNKFGSYPAIAKNETGKWDGWYCDRLSGTGISKVDHAQVNMNAACALQYGQRAIFAKSVADRSGPAAWAVRIGDGAGDWRCVN